MRGNLIVWRPLWAVILFCFLPNPAFADTYSATAEHGFYAGGPNGAVISTFDATIVGACAKASCQPSSNPSYPTYCGAAFPGTYSSSCGYETVPSTLYTCPYGGTLALDPTPQCIFAPPCIAPEIRNPIIGQCQVPANCSVGESIDPNTNTCIPVTCPPDQLFLSSPSNPSGGCVAVPPMCSGNFLQTCGVSESYCMNENGSFTVTPACPLPPTCPTGQHLAPDGKTCAPNLPLSCPIGQHANADNTACIADDPSACPPGTYHGYINGQSQCIQGTNPNPDNTTPPSTNTATATTKPGVQNSTATTTTNPDGTTTTNTTTTQAPSTTDFKFDTTGLAKDSTIQHIVDGINKTSGKTAFNKSLAGEAPPDDNQAQITAKKQELQALISGIKSQFAGLTPTLSGSGYIPCDSGVYVPGLHITLKFCMTDYQQYFPLIGNALYFVAAVAALAIILG